MKTFEEQYTAWLDGRLSGPELAAFEAQLEKGLPNGITKEMAGVDRNATRQLGALLRRNHAESPAPVLKNPDFFNRRILQQIEDESPQSESPAPAPKIPWSFRRLVWTGLGSLAAAALVFITLVLPGLQQNGPPPEYYARILNTKTEAPGISAVAVHSNEENVTVLWIDGLEYQPSAKTKN